MSGRSQAQVFKAGSTTYFHSSLFFAPAMRDEVFALYGFVRTADNFVDAVPQQAEAFARFAARYRAARDGTPAGDPLIDDFVALQRRRGFDPDWTEAFLGSMAADLKGS
ncbi:MAG TPA: squalene/phytoene synthase family protein, partial [Kiritimatiellia bacterium]|nr:squalene/phytoene synthase family protein [Kiritimatiellia bacterium]